MTETSFETIDERLDALPQAERFLLQSLRTRACCCRGAPARCPLPTGSCPETPACQAALPPQGALRAVILVLRFLAAARDTGDACCWDAALDEAEAGFGERQGPVVVGRAGALIRRLSRAGADLTFLPPPCRRLSAGEALLLGALRDRPSEGSRVAFGPASEAVGALAQIITSPDASRNRQAA